MNVHIERNFVSAGYDITFYDRRPTLHVLRLADDPWDRVWEEVNEMERVKPTLTLPPEALEALLAEAEKVIPASHATERHLHDAVVVRDRLLKLVEEGWTS